ncbi:response regulator [Paenibacillus sp. sgz500958]|uniref:response regulator n=1 Tax=Paenibacillus sp. sgz500958 TaxID=3242475 RepID=UPI0036D26293
MPKILIVDDESIFRKGLRKMISSLDDSWEIVGEASDGYDALDKLEEFAPEVLLTDIRMPRMDGIQLQKVAGGRFKDLMTVVVSGYDEFVYVQQSMRQGAKDYLTKPVEREELGRVLEKLKLEIAERQAKPSQASWGAQPTVRRHVTEHLIESLLKGKTDENELKLLSEMGIVFQHPYFVCMVIKLDKHSVEKERYLRSDASLFQLYIQQFVQEMIDRHAKGLSFVLSDTEVVALVNVADTKQSWTSPGSLGEMIRRQIRSLSKLTVTIGISTPVEGLQSIPKAYNEAEIALLYRLIVGGDNLLEYEAMTSNSHFGTTHRKWSWEMLENSIVEGRREKFNGIIGQLIDDLCSSAPSPESIHQQICKLLLYYYELAEELGVTEQWLGSKDIRKVLFEICAISSRQELTEQCQELLSQLTDVIALSREQHDRDPIAAAQRYIEAHFEQPLTLKEVADEVFLNPAYFSNLFKQKAGVTFIEHLTQVRTREARKRLAFTNDKINVIAEETGFANVRHFNRVFKNLSGLSPKEYRDSTRTEAN